MPGSTARVRSCTATAVELDLGALVAGSSSAPGRTSRYRRCCTGSLISRVGELGRPARRGRRGRTGPRRGPRPRRRASRAGAAASASMSVAAAGDEDQRVAARGQFGGQRLADAGGGAGHDRAGVGVGVGRLTGSGSGSRGPRIRGGLRVQGDGGRRGGAACVLTATRRAGCPARSRAWRRVRRRRRRRR